MKPLLPQLTEKLAPGPVQGSWNINSTPVFTQIAQSLKHPDGAISTRINSIPSPWARALLFQSAFLSSQHPNRQTLIQEYIGFLACLAFSRVKSLQIQAKLVDLKTLKQTYSFADSLFGLLPSELDSVYSPIQGVNPWEQIYTFSTNGNPLGFSSPSTLVAPSLSLSPVLMDSISWIEEVQPFGTSSRQKPYYRFTDPVPYLSQIEKAAFTAWLANLKKSIGSPNGNQKLEESIKQIISDYINNVSVQPSVSTSISQQSQVYGVVLSPKPLSTLEQIIDPSALEPGSNVKIISGTKAPASSIYFVDKNLAPQILSIPAHEIYVEEATTLAAFQLDTDAKNGAYYFTAADFFLPRMRWIRGAGMLTGSWLNEIQPDKESRTVIPPLNPKLRSFFSSEDLKSRLKLSEVIMSEGTGIRVSLEFEITGTDKPQRVVVNCDYLFRAEDELQGELPYLALWPNLPDDMSWSSFYTIVEESKNRNISNYAFTIEGLSSTETVIEGDSDSASGSIFRLWQSAAHPDVLSIIDKRNEHIGLIPVSTPSASSSRSRQWTVGVDFGTSFTNIHVSKGGSSERLSLNMLTLNITYKPDNFDINKYYFVPVKLTAPVDGHNPPMSTLLTVRGAKDTGKTPEFLSGARIYVPSLTEGEMRDYVISDIKWTKPKYLDAFLVSLINLVSAHAACFDVNRISWKASYPTALSARKIQGYQNAWIRAIDSAKKTGRIDHILGTDGNQATAFKTESIAFAQYFVDRLGEQIGYATCLDIGGGTSDISIWKDLKLLHQLSVPFAGRDIFHNILRANTARVGEIFGIKNESERNKMLSDLSVSGDNFDAYLDNYLRVNGASVLEKLRNADQTNIIYRFRGLLAFAYAGIYFYIGLVLSYLQQEEAAPVYLGGNGSRFVNWIDPDSMFGDASEINQLLSYILAKAGNFSVKQLRGTVLSKHPKEEAAGGLVIEKTKLTGLSSTNPEAFAGIGMEFITDIGQIRFNADQELVWPADFKTIQEIRIPDFSEISRFVSTFNEGIRYCGLQTMISPLEDTTAGQALAPIEFELRNQVKQLLNQKVAINGGSRLNYEPDPGFIVAHKALLQVLAKKWAKEA
jgi:hypothetical protein